METSLARPANARNHALNVALKAQTGPREPNLKGRRLNSRIMPPVSPRRSDGTAAHGGGRADTYATLDGLRGVAAFSAGERVGAVGVSGLPGEVDEQLALAAIAAAGLDVPPSS